MHSINATRESNENDRFSAQLRRAKLMSGRYIENVAFLGLKCRYPIFSAKFTHAYIHTYIHTYTHSYKHDLFDNAGYKRKWRDNSPDVNLHYLSNK